MALNHTFTAPCRQVSCLRLGFPADFQAMFGHQEVVVSYHAGATIMLLIFELPYVYQGDKHSQQQKPNDPKILKKDLTRKSDWIDMTKIPQDLILSRLMKMHMLLLPPSSSKYYLE